MRTKTLAINEVYAARVPVVYTCHGLGSCIGLFIVDRLKQISGGAHIPLPFAHSEGEFRDAKSLIDQLLRLFCDLGSDLVSLRAKVAGGADLFGSTMNVGGENAKMVLWNLVERKIFIASTDVGGEISRTARFNSATHELQITTSDKKSYVI